MSDPSAERLASCSACRRGALHARLPLTLLPTCASRLRPPPSCPPALQPSLPIAHAWLPRARRRALRDP
jgi:hypothetical protein